MLKKLYTYYAILQFSQMLPIMLLIHTHYSIMLYKKSIEVH